MKDILKTGLILMIFTAISGLFLGVVYTGVKGKIQEADRAAKLNAIKFVLKDPITGEYLVDEKTIEEVVKKTGIETVVLKEYREGAVLGPVYEFETKDGRRAYVLSGYAPGFGGNVTTVACFLETKNGLILNSVRVIDYSQETPGLGARIGEESVQRRFFLIPPEGLKNGLRVDKDAGSPKGTPEELKKKGIVKVSDVMTGATITPRAVVTALNLMYRYLTEEVLK
ncbi:RnfABCDGE type electron transport complex subunit G [Thermotoga sp.]|uniref:RnfABCDGE type electron transport complex subunit G n=1 Tax=Thermotoga sp. TaxID=28240 RepID=UPI0025D2BDA7|nr:RnfABCDGE type electron transport complex subunit G [Thermotoga sp.]MCD6551760.1 RnfABCDGE type electron transport complex subunit G [Thermotoga sp.]